MTFLLYLETFRTKKLVLVRKLHSLLPTFKKYVKKKTFLKITFTYFYKKWKLCFSTLGEYRQRFVDICNGNAATETFQTLRIEQAFKHVFVFLAALRLAGVTFRAPGVGLEVPSCEATSQGMNHNSIALSARQSRLTEASTGHAG